MYFSSSIRWPQVPETLVSFHREFAAANDYIFWGNGVADRGLHNATVHNRNAVLIESDQISLVDNSRWSQYINAEPVHTVVYRNPLDIVISPWWNLDADYLDVTEDYRQTLINFKNDFYPGLVQGFGRGRHAWRGLCTGRIYGGRDGADNAISLCDLRPCGTVCECGRGWSFHTAGYCPA